MTLHGRLDRLEQRQGSRPSPALGLMLGDMIHDADGEITVEEWRRRHPDGLLVTLRFDDAGLEPEEL